MKSILVILLFAVFSVKCYADNSENAVDTTKYIFILDDKIIPAICCYFVPEYDKMRK